MRHEMRVRRRFDGCRYGLLKGTWIVFQDAPLAAVILLDEPTASIDPLEEQALYERFMEIAAGRTAILVTQLLERRGLYHEMISAQAAWYRRGP